MWIRSQGCPLGYSQSCSRYLDGACVCFPHSTQVLAMFSISVSMPDQKTKERAKSFILTIFMWAAWRSARIARRSDGNMTTLCFRSKQSLESVYFTSGVLYPKRVRHWFVSRICIIFFKWKSLRDSHAMFFARIGSCLICYNTKWSNPLPCSISSSSINLWIVLTVEGSGIRQ